MLSLDLISSSIDSSLTDLSLICLWRLSALIFGSAQRKNLKVASGKTTVPISLPSITTELVLEDILNCLYTKFLISGFFA